MCRSDRGCNIDSHLLRIRRLGGVYEFLTLVSCCSYVVSVYHPSNRVISSDVIPRYMVIKWLLTCITTNYGAQNAKLALFIDWFTYKRDCGKIMCVSFVHFSVWVCSVRHVESWCCRCPSRWLAVARCLNRRKQLFFYFVVARVLAKPFAHCDVTGVATHVWVDDAG